MFMGEHGVFFVPPIPFGSKMAIIWGRVGGISGATNIIWRIHGNLYGKTRVIGGATNTLWRKNGNDLCEDKVLVVSSKP